MTDDTDLERVERMLRRTPAPEFVPATAAAAARQAALGGVAPVVRAPRIWRWPTSWRLASVAVAFAAAVAVAVVVTAGGGGFAKQYELSLSGAHGATAEVDFGHAANGVRPMLVQIHGLPPASAGHYYEMWFRTRGTDKVSAVTFNTAAGGRATFKAVIPAGMTWRNCWVTREAIGGDSKPAMVLST